MLDHEKNIVNVNNSTTKLLEYPKQEIIGKPVSYIFPDNYQNSIYELFETSSNSIINFETNLKTKNNIIIPV